MHLRVSVVLRTKRKLSVRGALTLLTSVLELSVTSTPMWMRLNFPQKKTARPLSCSDAGNMLHIQAWDGRMVGDDGLDDPLSLLHH